MKRVFFLIAICMACWPMALPAQQAQPAVTLKQIAGPVYLLQGGGGNVAAVADPGGIVLIDAMEASAAEGIGKALQTLPGGGRVRILVNTHWHFDHVGGNALLASGALIITHENVWPLLTQDQTIMGNPAKALPAAGQPNLTFGDRLTLYVGGESIRLIHYPHAHTDGDTAVFLDKQKVVHLGDMFFNGMFPFLDVENGGDIDNWVRQLDAILASLPPDAKIIPGHGPLAGVPELKAFRRMLFDSAEFVRKQMQEGKTLDQIKASTLPPQLESWAKGFMRPPQWLQLVYRSLEKQKRP